ncbi:MAG: cbb3-type cytochrome oxidase assembly protein CcoS [Pseudomonadales bacterium]
MPSLYLLIPIALLFVGLAALLVWWAVGSGQYRDLDREADRILFQNLDPLNKALDNTNSAETDNDSR